MREVRQRVGEDQLLEASEEHRWIVDAVAPASCWSPPLVIDAHPLLPATELGIYRATRIAGRARRSDRRPLQTLTLQLTPPGAAEPVRVAIPVEKEGRFTASVPAATLDLRLGGDGTAPRYFQALDLSAGGRDLGEIVLTPGASLAGWIAVPERRPSFASVTVKLLPDSLDVRNRDKAALATTPDQRGFFQFTNVIPGTYSVTAERKESSPVRRSAIAVAAGRETLLDPPLRINVLARLDVTITPALAPDGQPWVVELNRRLPLSTYTEGVAQSKATLGGAWSRSGLQTDAHDLRIRDASGHLFASRYFDVTVDMPPLLVDIPLIPVRGDVRAGDKALECDVRFFSRSGDSITMHANADGRFTGYLAHEGEWKYDVKIARWQQTLLDGRLEIHRRDGAEYANADIKVPGGRVRGRVLDPDGNGTSALVFVQQKKVTHTNALSDKDGTFEIIGLDEGPGVVRAMKRELSATPLDTQVVEDPPEVTLRLRKAHSIELTVVSSSGMPVAGGILHYRAPSLSVVGQDYLSPSGRAKLDIAVDEPFSVAIVAPGLPVKIASMNLPNEVTAATVVVPETGGTLRVKGLDLSKARWPFLIHDGAPENTSLLMIHGYESSPVRVGPGGMEIFVEPGSYMVCPAYVPDARCVSATVAPNAVAEVEAK